MLGCLLYCAPVLWENRRCCIKPCSYGNHDGSAVMEDCGLFGSGGVEVDFVLMPRGVGGFWGVLLPALMISRVLMTDR